MVILSTGVLGYTNQARHYAVDIPAGWTPLSDSGASTGGLQPDAMYRSPTFPSDPSFFAVMSGADPQARNTSAYVMTAANQFRSGLTQAGGGITASEPQAKTIAGRPAAELTASLPLGAGSLNIRTVVFSSEYHKLSYFIAFYTTSDMMSATQTTWENIIESFRVLDEGPAGAPGAGLNPLFIAGGSAAVAGASTVITVAITLSRRKRRAAMLLQPYAMQPQMGSMTGGAMGQQPSMEPQDSTMLPPPPPGDEPRP